MEQEKKELTEEEKARWRRRWQNLNAGVATERRRKRRKKSYYEQNYEYEPDR